MNLVFYDLETSVLSSSYHYMLQFAAIFTDENLVMVLSRTLRKHIFGND